MKIVRVLVWNTILGILTLLVANQVWPRVGYPWWGVLLTAVGGIPGAFLVVLLKLLVVPT